MDSNFRLQVAGIFVATVGRHDGCRISYGKIPKPRGQH